MNSQERISAVLNGREPDRVPYHDSYWATTIERWRGEGMPADVSPDEYFGCEFAGLAGDYTLQLPERVIEETDRYRIYVDANGATRRDMVTGDGWTPDWLEFSISTRDDWERLKERALYDPSRLGDGIVSRYEAARRQGKFVAFRAHACFHPTWNKIGMVRLLTGMIEEPELITDMFDAHTRLITQLYDGIVALGVSFDGAWLSDDLGYRNAPLISPQMYRDLVMPYHRAACGHFARDGLKTILHSDGNVGPLIPDFLEAGFGALHPLEAKADLDAGELKSRYGDRLVLFGNIDVRALAGSRDQIEAEIRGKLEAGMPGGGYMFHSDHSVPSDVSLDNYRFALDVLKRYGDYSRAG